MYESLAMVVSPPLPIALLDSLEGRLLDEYFCYDDSQMPSHSRYFVEDEEEACEFTTYDQALADLIDARDDRCEIANFFRKSAEGLEIGDDVDFIGLDIETILQSLIANSGGQIKCIIVEYGWSSRCPRAGQIGGSATILTRDSVEWHSTSKWVHDRLDATGMSPASFQDW